MRVPCVLCAQSRNASARWLGVLCSQGWEGAWGGLEMEAGSSSWETSLSLSQTTSLILDFGIWIYSHLVGLPQCCMPV